MTEINYQCPDEIRHTLMPIVNFNSGNIFSFEIKRSTPKENEHVNNHHCDERLSFMEQLAFFQTLNKQDASLYRVLFIDMPMGLLDSSNIWKDFIPFIVKFRVNVGIGMPKFMGEPSDISLDNIVKLKSFGVRFWVVADDEWSSWPISKASHPYVDGVKIGRDFFAAEYGRQDAARLRGILRAWGGEQTIVHGLEHKEHFAFAVSNGFVLGQGAYCRAHACH